MPAGRKLGRPPRIHRDEIVKAVIDLGFADASIGSIAGHLGVRHSTLYGHFPSRDAIAEAAAEAVLADHAWPAAGADWREYLSGLAHGLFELCVQHRGLGRDLVMLPRVPPTATALISRMATTLIEAGLEPGDAIVAANAVFHVSVDMFAERATPEATEQRRAQVLGGLDDIDPVLREPLLTAVGRSADEWFAATLGIVLDGIGFRLDGSLSGSPDIS
jgi:TetR/AcrR family tetracycline transcriptional repressor